MGASNSKTVVTPSKPEPSRPVRNERVSRLADPRSPSSGIDRTPIQVGAASQGPAEVGCERPAPVSDPRSPSVGIARTPMKAVLRATVDSFTRRLGMLLLNDGVEVAKFPPSHTVPKIEDLTGDVEGEMDSTEPLLPLGTPLEPVTSPNSDSNVVVEMGVEAGQFLDGEVDDCPPLDGELSSSLLGCREGVISSQSLIDLHLSCTPPHDSDTHKDLVTEDAEDTRPPSPEASIPSAPLVSSEADCQPEAEEPHNPSPASQVQALQNQPASGENGIKLPTFNTQSPSQVVFKPQWLGVGFGIAGVRARGLQGRGRSGTSPLSVRNGQNAGSENRGQMTKQKQRGKVLGGEGRSPLQILRTNSPRDHASQMKLKMTTPDRARRILSVSVDKENQ